MLTKRGTNIVPAAAAGGGGAMTRRPSDESVAATTQRTKEALDDIINQRRNKSEDPQYVRYVPSTRRSDHMGAPEKYTIKIYEKPVDPLEPPKFSARKAPAPPPSPPPPVLHSPPRKLTAQDQAAWKIPPCISNRKNNSGHVIALDKRLAADGRGLQDVTLSDGFARLSEALFIAERDAREEVERRAAIQKNYLNKEQERRNQELLEVASKARAERISEAAAAAATSTAEGSENTTTTTGDEWDEKVKREKAERDKIRDERHLERERERRLAAFKGNRTKSTRDNERDISEAIALGTAKLGADHLYDQRLFNQTEGLGSGFGDEEDYNIYQKPLFTDGRSSALYRPPRLDSDVYGTALGGEGDPQAIASIDRFKPARDFSGVDRSKKRTDGKPVQFEKAAATTTATEQQQQQQQQQQPDQSAGDIYGIGDLLASTTSEVRSGKRNNPLDAIGKQGTMLAGSAAFGSRSTYDGGSSSGSSSSSRMSGTGGFVSAGSERMDAERTRAPGLSGGVKRERDDSNDDGDSSDRKRSRYSHHSSSHHHSNSSNGSSSHRSHHHSHRSRSGSRSRHH